MGRIQYLLMPLLLAVMPISGAVADPVTLSSGPARVPLIELFTSQGCSSCPPAERWLSNLKENPGLWNDFVPVAFHVDYWDYLGWRDTLADPAFSTRQRRYRAQGGIDTVYTPGFVVNGREWRGWFGKRALPDEPAHVGALTVKIDGDRIDARFDSARRGEGALWLNLALLGGDISQRVAAGENEGRRLVQDFSVLRFVRLRSDDGRWEGVLPRAAGDFGRRALAAWVSRGDELRPLQAVGGWLPSP